MSEEKNYILRHTDIRIQAERVWLDALLSHSPGVRGLVIVALPYMGRLRESRENYAAGLLREAGFATLIVSMLTPHEEARDPDVRFDVSTLHQRLQAIVAWLDQQPGLAGLPLGLLAVSTVVSAGVRLLVRDPERISALVSRSGRADLAGADPLRRLRVPFLMLVPGAERDLRVPSEQAYALLGAVRDWKLFDQASAGFIEPGSLEAAGQAARDWFLRHMPVGAPAPSSGAVPPSDARS